MTNKYEMMFCDGSIRSFYANNNKQAIAIAHAVKAISLIKAKGLTKINLN